MPSTTTGRRAARAAAISIVAATLAVGACRIERNPPPDRAPAAPPALLRGLRSSIHHVHDLAAARQWYADALGREPYFDQPFYVGFELGGYELGLSPDTVEARPGPGGAIAYWAVANADSATRVLTSRGAILRSAVQDVGDGVRVAIIEDPFGNLLGLIEGAPDPRNR